MAQRFLINRLFPHRIGHDDFLDGRQYHVFDVIVFEFVGQNLLTTSPINNDLLHISSFQEINDPLIAIPNRLTVDGFDKHPLVCGMYRNAQRSVCSVLTIFDTGKSLPWKAGKLSTLAHPIRLLQLQIFDCTMAKSLNVERCGQACLHLVRLRFYVQSGGTRVTD